MQKRVMTGITAVLSLIVLASGFLLLFRKMQYGESERGLAEARTVMDAAGLCVPAKDSDAPVTENGVRTAGKEENVPENDGTVTAELPEEFLGRLLIPKIGADLAVMRPPKEDPEKYLTRDAFGRDSAYGTIYADPAASVSGCLVLYGHHMKNGAMFGNIGKLSAKDRVTIITPEDVYGYAVIASFTVTPEEAEAASALSLLSEEDADAVSRQAEKTGVLHKPPELIKKHLALVTCEYERPGEKLVVLCEEP